MSFLSNPIVDRGLPSLTPEFSRFIRQLYTDMFNGVNTVVHCHGGIGRSGTVAAAILLHCGFTAEQAFAHITKKRGVPVPDTVEQVGWIVTRSASILRG
ncbi:MAG: dual specificity protein phosphatase family protein [Granulosicoccus sp.]